MISVVTQIYKYRQYPRWLVGAGALLLLVSLCNPVSAKTTPAHAQQGWIINQSSNFAGTVFSEVTANALRMKVGRLGLIFITKAPDWNAYVFNENTRNFVQLPYNEWQRRFVIGQTNKLMDENGQIRLSSRNTGKFDKICKFKAVQYVVERKADLKHGIPEQKLTELWIATDIKAPPQITQIFCSRLNVPAAKGIPLRAIHRTNGKMVQVLDTLDVQKKTLPDSLFEPMKNYKRVKDEMGLMMDESAEDMVNDLLDTTSPNMDFKPEKKH